MGSKGIITVSLLSLDELNSIIHDARVQFGVTPIFNSEQITLYNQVMKVLFAPQALILQIPVASKHKFHHFKFIPFPTFYMDKMIILDNGGKNNLLISHDSKFFVEVNDIHLLECINAERLVICPSNILTIYSTLSENMSCLNVILLPRSFYHTDASCQSSLRQTEEQTATMTVGGRIFITQKAATVTQVTCNGTTVTSRNRTYSVKNDCDISSSDFNIFGTKSHDVILRRNRITPTLMPFHPGHLHHKNFTILQQVDDVTPFEKVINHQVVKATTPIAVLMLILGLVITNIVLWRQQRRQPQIPTPVITPLQHIAAWKTPLWAWRFWGGELSVLECTLRPYDNAITPIGQRPHAHTLMLAT